MHLSPTDLATVAIILRHPNPAGRAVGLGTAAQKAEAALLALGVLAVVFLAGVARALRRAGGLLSRLYEASIEMSHVLMITAIWVSLVIVALIAVR